MKASGSMHLPNEDNIAHSAGSMDLDLDSIFGVSPRLGKPQEKAKSLCPECQQKGRESYLAPYQINFEEAIYLCPVQSCSYPMKESNLVESFVFKQDAASLPLLHSSKSTRKSRKSSGYSAFFEEFDPDTFFEFPTPTVENEVSSDVNLSSQMSVSGTSYPTAANVPEADVYSSHVLESDQSEPVQARRADSLLQTAVDDSAITLDQEASTSERDHDLPMDVDINRHEDVDVDPLIATDITDRQDEVSEVKGHFKTLEIPSEKLHQKLSPPSMHSEMVQWVNEANSCWIDSIMQVLTRSFNARALLNCNQSGEESVVKQVFVTYDECQNFHQKDLNSSKQIQEKDLITLSKTLGDARGHLLESLKVKTFFKPGEFQSLLEMFPSVLRLDRQIENLFKVCLLWDFHCDKCGHRRARRSNADIVSLPRTLSSFHPLNAQFHRVCYECKHPEGVMTILMEKLSPCLAFHFQKGLPHSNLRVLDFALQGHLYSVFAIVQYIVEPFKHFVTWVRDVKSSKWLCCDDLKGPVVAQQTRPPRIPANQIHMVFWEKQTPGGMETIKTDDLFTVVNEEAVAHGEEIPLEMFFAHEDDETIVLSEDENAGSGGEISETILEKPSTDTLPQATRPGEGHLKPESDASSSRRIKNLVNGNTEVSVPGNPTSEPTGMMQNMSDSGSYQFQPSMFTNGGVTVVPDHGGRQTIQLVAPANTCSIYIVTNDDKNRSYLHTGDPPFLTSRRSAPCSFIENSHSYNMVADGIHGSMNFRGEGHRMPCQKLKRHYRLSGYSRLHSGDRFSPMKVSKPSQATRLSRNSVEAQSDKSSNSRPDSETLSEVSELSDLLPDFDFDLNNSRQGHAATPLSSLPNSSRNTPIIDFK